MKRILSSVTLSIIILSMHAPLFSGGTVSSLLFSNNQQHVEQPTRAAPSVQLAVEPLSPTQLSPDVQKKQQALKQLIEQIEIGLTQSSRHIKYNYTQRVQQKLPVHLETTRHTLGAINQIMQCVKGREAKLIQFSQTPASEADQIQTLNEISQGLFEGYTAIKELTTPQAIAQMNQVIEAQLAQQTH